MSLAKCCVCLNVLGEARFLLLCRKCSRSLGRVAAKDATIYATIAWAARRARWAERRRVKARCGR
jgi:hypothetical protein